MKDFKYLENCLPEHLCVIAAHRRGIFWKRNFNSGIALDSARADNSTILFSLKNIPAITLFFLLFSCSGAKDELKHTIPLVNETWQRDSFYVYNSFDSLKVLVLEKDSLYKLIVVENDTFNARPFNPVNKTSYTISTAYGKKIEIINSLITDRIDSFEWRNTPQSPIVISKDELQLIKNYSFTNNDTCDFNLKKYTARQKFQPEQFNFIEDDFDDDGVNEYCITAISYFEGEKSAFTTIIENEKNEYKIVFGFNSTTEHFEVDIPQYNELANLFILRYDVWGSCHEMDEHTLVKYFDNKLIEGPVIATLESSCVDEAHPDDVTYIYYKEIKQKFIPISNNKFRIDTEFVLWAGQENGNNGKDILKKHFSIEYLFSPMRGRFEILYTSDGDIATFEEDHFAEAGKFLEASLPDIKRMKTEGTPEQKEYLKDFTYFDE